MNYQPPENESFLLSFFQEKTFYRAVDNNLDNKENDESDWMINKDSQVENN